MMENRILSLRKRTFIISILSAIGLLLSTFLYLRITAELPRVDCHETSENADIVLNTTQVTTRSATILFWNRVIRIPHREYTLALSDDRECHFTNNHSVLRDSKLVVVHFHALSWWGNGTGDDPNVPAVHPPEQEWVFLTQEPPTLQVNVDPALMQLFGLHFNATATYMSETDVDARYGYYFPRRIPLNEQKNAINYASNRSKLAVWLSSHCDGPRTTYINELKQVVEVDIYGYCGTQINECSNKEETSVCLQYLSKMYKFYIAFENSDCKDYITEKFWKNSLSVGMVPIVRGKRSNYETLAPPGSFISADWFSSPKELGEYLLLLNQSDSLYNQYFVWKRDYEVYANPMVSDTNQKLDDFDVQLCQYAHRSSSAPKWYDMYKEIFGVNLCA